MSSKKKSIEATARRIINSVLDGFIEEGIDQRLFYDLLETPEGNQCPVYQGLSKHGYGDILCHYIPQKAVEKILTECEQVFERLSFDVTDPESKETVKRYLADLKESQGDHEVFIEALAYLATRQLMVGFLLKLSWALEENFEESLLFAEKCLYSMMAEDIFGEGLTHTGVISRPDIEALAQKAAKKRREHLTGLLRTFPEIVVNPKGRRPKLTIAKVRSSIVKFGDGVGRKGVAYDLGVTVKALDEWRKVQGYPNWKAVVTDTMAKWGK